MVLELNKIENFINNYLIFLNKKKHSENYINEYFNILNIINKNYNDIVNYIYNINNNLYINFCDNLGIYNISKLFKNNISNIKLKDKDLGASNSVLLSCLYKNKPAIIKLFYDPFVSLNISYSLFYEQLVNLKIKKFQENDINNKFNSKFYFPEIYEIGYIELSNLFDNDDFKNEIYNSISEIYEKELNDPKIKNYFKEIVKMLLDNDTSNNNLNSSSYKFRLFNKFHFKYYNYWINLLLFFLNINNKYIHVSIVEDLTQYNEVINIIDIYSKYNYVNKKNNLIDFDDKFFIILYQIFEGIYLLNEKLEIIHNDIHLENIMIINHENKIRCIIIDFNFSYINNEIFNIGIFKRFNDGIKNIFNKSYDIFTFITFLGTICNYMHKNSIQYDKCTILDQTYNIYTYNKNNFKYLNKIFFKNNKLLKDLVIEHVILFMNNVIHVPILYYNINDENNIGCAYDIINNKYFIKKLKKLNYL